jgi:hypothetical protein
VIGVGRASGVPITIDQKNTQRFGMGLLQQVYCRHGATEASADDCDTTT